MPYSILQSLEHHALHIGTHHALVGHRYQSQNIEHLTYQELDALVTQSAAELQRLQPRCIALRGENSLDWAIADLAAIKANIPCVPVPMFFSKAQTTHLLQSSGADLLVGDWPDCEQEAQGYLGAFPVFVRSEGNAQKLLPQTAKVTFTSGSTGTPKGVCLSTALLNMVSQNLAQATEHSSDKHMVLLPLSTLLENITGIYVPLIMGSTSLIFNGAYVGLSGSSRFDAQNFAKALASHRPQSMVLTPALLTALTQIAAASPELAHSLSYVAVGGAPLTKESVLKAAALDIPVYQGYGLSECGSVVSVNRPSANRPGSCGQPLPHMQLKLAEDGEVLVKGETALGYIDEPFTTPWLATGDIGSLDDDGFLTIHGRKKNLIITSFGRNISPEWIESLAGEFLNGRPFIVIDDSEQGISGVVAEPFNLKDVQLIQTLNKQLPDYAQLHTVIAVPEFNQIPGLFTANGRPVRAAIDTFVKSNSDITNTAAYPLTFYQIDTEDFEMSDFFQTLQQQTRPARQNMLQAPIFNACIRGEIDLQTYTAFLTQAFHHVKHTVPLLMACGGRLSSDYDWLQPALAEYIAEEQGHHEWILNDIQACGFDTDAVRNNQAAGKACQAIDLMVSYLYHQIDRSNPLALFGMVWVLEGTSVSVGGEIATLIQNTLALPDSAMSYLRSHSSLDQEHIKLFEGLMNRISDPQDQQVIIDSANIVFDLYAAMLTELTQSHKG